MSSLLSIVCDNCGAKWKLPESDQRSQAKCQKCGSVIDVSGQRSGAAAAAAPTAARPAVARPAVDRSKEPAPTASKRPALGQPPERARRTDRSERAERTGRSARQSAAKDSPKRPLWPWIVGGVIVIAVILFFVLRK